MYKEATYKEKYAVLKDWLPSIVESIKKDIKNEHLKKDFLFIKKYLGSKNPHKVTTEELVEAYQKAIEQEDNGEDLGEFLTSRWLLKNTDLYEFFDKKLSEISDDFTSLEEIELPAAQTIIAQAVNEYGACDTYLFSVLNSVVFPAEAYKQLSQQATKEKEIKKKETTQKEEQLTFDNMKQSYEIEMARLTDKYEKKLAGLQKKYAADTESLKKQIAQLQRKLNEK